MKKTTRIWTGVSTAIVGFATVLGAQTTSAPQSTTPSTEAQITVTGCLKQGVMSVGPAGTAGVAGTAGTAGTAGATGTAGTAGTATASDANAAALMFTLINATAAPGDGSSAPDTATAGTTGATSTTGAATATGGSSGKTYRLIANPTALSPLVGKKLALTGVLDPQDNAAQANDPSAGPNANAPVLRVKSGKVVAESCQQP
jgi:hypothetical protein